MTGAIAETGDIVTTSGPLAIVDIPEEQEFQPFDGIHGTIGILSLTKDGAWTYQTRDNLHGIPNGTFTDEFPVWAKDGTEATVKIMITGINEAPLLASKYLSVIEDQKLNGSLTATDPDGDDLTYSSPDGPEHGTLFFSDSFYSVPNTDFYGLDSFTIVVDDGHGGTATTTAGVLVGNDWDAPFGSDKSVTIAEDGSHTVVVDDFGFSDYKDAGSQINHFDAAIISAVSGAGNLRLGRQRSERSRSSRYRGPLGTA